MADLNQHLNQINDCFYNNNGVTLSEQLSLNDLIIHTINTHPATIHPIRITSKVQETRINNKVQLFKRIDTAVKKVNDIGSYVETKIDSSITQYQTLCDTVSYRLRAISAIFDHDYSEGFKYLSESLDSFGRTFEYWSMQALWKMCYDLRLMAKLCTIDTQSKENTNQANHKIDYQEESSRILGRCFQSATGDRTNSLEQSKKRASMGITNHLFHVYFKLNNLKLCKNLIKAIESPGFPSLDSYPQTQLITYKFSVGRLAAFDGNFKKAQQDLLYSFNRCPSSYPKNKKLILLYLIPMQLAHCKFPKKQLLEQYGLNQFLGIVEGMKSGNIRQFNQCLQTNQNFFISKGIYLILEKLKNIVYRNLFKKVYLINKSSTRVSIQHCVAALKWVENENVDVDEAECIISNLIFNGYIKGYISHKVGIILSSTNPFPALNPPPNLA